MIQQIFVVDLVIFWWSKIWKSRLMLNHFD